MANISKIKLNNQLYTLKDEVSGYTTEAEVKTNHYTKQEVNALGQALQGNIDLKQNISSLETDVAAKGFTKNTGTVTSVAVKMNGATKGTVTTTGEIDLGTVITAHQDISGKENTSNKVISIDSESTDTQYPSAKAVYTAINDAIGAAIAAAY